MLINLFSVNLLDWFPAEHVALVSIRTSLDLSDSVCKKRFEFFALIYSPIEDVGVVDPKRTLSTFKTFIRLLAKGAATTAPIPVARVLVSSLFYWWNATFGGNKTRRWWVVEVFTHQIGSCTVRSSRGIWANVGLDIGWLTVVQTMWETDRWNLLKFGCPSFPLGF